MFFPKSVSRFKVQEENKITTVFWWCRFQSPHNMLPSICQILTEIPRYEWRQWNRLFLYDCCSLTKFDVSIGLILMEKKVCIWTCQVWEIGKSMILDFWNKKSISESVNILTPRNSYRRRRIQRHLTVK